MLNGISVVVNRSSKPQGIRWGYIVAPARFDDVSHGFELRFPVSGGWFLADDTIIRHGNMGRTTKQPMELIEKPPAI